MTPREQTVLEEYLKATRRIQADGSEAGRCTTRRIRQGRTFPGRTIGRRSLSALRSAGPSSARGAREQEGGRSAACRRRTCSRGAVAGYGDG